MVLFFLAIAIARGQLTLRQPGGALSHRVVAAAESTIPFAEQVLRWPVVLLPRCAAGCEIRMRAVFAGVTLSTLFYC
jgi:hypothetical protein